MSQPSQQVVIMDDADDTMSQCTVMEDGTGQSPPANVERMFYCYFQCGGPRPESTLRRSSEKGNWMCKPCYNAKRAIEMAAKGDPVAKDALIKLKQDDHEAWMLKVRTSRVAPGEPGSWANASARQRSVAEFVKVLKQGTGVVEKQPVHYLTHRRFLAYQKMYEGLSVEEAKAEWARSLDDAAVDRRGSGDNVALAVSAWPTVEGFRYREMQASVGQSSALNTEADATTAMDDVVHSGAQSSFLYGATFGPMGDVLRPGSSSVPSECAGQAGMTNLVGEAPPTAAIVSDTEFAKAAAMRVGGAARVLRARPSDVEVEAKKKRRVESVTGVTGKLADEQKKAVAKYKAILTDFSRVNVGKKCKDFYANMWKRPQPGHVAAMTTESEAISIQWGVDCLIYPLPPGQSIVTRTSINRSIQQTVVDQPVLKQCSSSAQPMLNQCSTSAQPMLNQCSTSAQPCRCDMVEHWLSIG